MIISHEKENVEGVDIGIGRSRRRGRAWLFKDPPLLLSGEHTSCWRVLRNNLTWGYFFYNLKYFSTSLFSHQIL